MNLRELKEIFRLVEKTDFSEVEIVQGDWRVRIERGKPPSILAASSFVPTQIAPQALDSTEMAEARGPLAKTDSNKPVPTESKSKQQVITSPFVGTFYRSPSPDSDPYVEVGQKVKEGETICIIEAMKLMNEIESDYDGKIVEIYPENGKPIEFGEKLFLIEQN